MFQYALLWLLSRNLYVIEDGSNLGGTLERWELLTLEYTCLLREQSVVSYLWLQALYRGKDINLDLYICQKVEVFFENLGCRFFTNL